MSNHTRSTFLRIACVTAYNKFMMFRHPTCPLQAPRERIAEETPRVTSAKAFLHSCRRKPARC
jgi:hypothetical protein